VVNFSGDAKEWIRLGLPRGGRWRVALDSSGFDEFGSPSQADLILDAEEEPWHAQPYSVTVRLAALSALVIVPAESQPSDGEAGDSRPHVGAPGDRASAVEPAPTSTEPEH
jgi:1,4-alpha-glucan branching enzyme